MIYLAYVFHWSYESILNMEDWEREFFAAQAENVIKSEQESAQAVNEAVAKMKGAKRSWA